mmetsp:Transcript_9744/g.33636  ORF Transcript_9744/g.33636 Transcript_9744/m.33636 type:complete len:215 (+) Transcript_9744:141-785(+)
MTILSVLVLLLRLAILAMLLWLIPSPSARISCALLGKSVSVSIDRTTPALLSSSTSSTTSLESIVSRKSTRVPLSSGETPPEAIRCESHSSASLASKSSSFSTVELLLVLARLLPALPPSPPFDLLLPLPLALGRGMHPKTVGLSSSGLLAGTQKSRTALSMAVRSASASARAGSAGLDILGSSLLFLPFLFLPGKKARSLSCKIPPSLWCHST